MLGQRTLLVILGISALATMVAAENRGSFSGGRGAPRSGGFSTHTNGRSVFTGGPRAPMGWSDFHHDTAPAKVAPHRFGTSNLPRPNKWSGDVHQFDLNRWQGGSWQHVNHDSQLGWWWVVGPDWYYFDQPVYPYPDLYTPLGEPIGWWYWCDPAQDYYPYVTYCPVGWESVMPLD